jgi:hypothetical protein
MQVFLSQKHVSPNLTLINFIASIPRQLSLQVLHCLVAIAVVGDLRVDQVVEVPEVLGLDGSEPLHQQPRYLNLLVVVCLREAELVFGLNWRNANFLLFNIWPSIDALSVVCG